MPKYLPTALAIKFDKYTYSHQRSKNGSEIRNRKFNVLEIDITGEEWAAAGLAWRKRRADGIGEVLDGCADVVRAEKSHTRFRHWSLLQLLVYAFVDLSSILICAI